MHEESGFDESVYDVTPLVYAAQLERQEIIHLLLTKYKRLADIHPVTRKINTVKQNYFTSLSFFHFHEEFNFVSMLKYICI